MNRPMLFLIGVLLIAGLVYFASLTSCLGVPTPAQTEGPYYKTGSPERKNIADKLSGEKLIVSGYVFDKNCKPVKNAWIDFWQADVNGVYDLQGFKLRGHQLTDSFGKFELTTIVPGEYGTRPPHIHVKIRAKDGPILTSQMYFPKAPKNQTDPIFNDALLTDVQEKENAKVATFNFVLNY